MRGFLRAATAGRPNCVCPRMLRHFVSRAAIRRCGLRGGRMWKDHRRTAALFGSRLYGSRSALVWPAMLVILIGCSAERQSAARVIQTPRIETSSGAVAAESPQPGVPSQGATFPGRPAPGLTTSSFASGRPSRPGSEVKDPKWEMWYEGSVHISSSGGGVGDTDNTNSEPWYTTYGGFTNSDGPPPHVYFTPTGATSTVGGGVMIFFPDSRARRANGLAITVPARFSNGRTGTTTYALWDEVGGSSAPFMALPPGKTASFRTLHQDYRVDVSRTSDGREFDFSTVPLKSGSAEQYGFTSMRLSIRLSAPAAEPFPACTLRYHLATSSGRVWDFDGTFVPHPDGTFQHH